MKALPLLFALIASPLLATDYKSDAFGIFDHETSPRDHWSGLQRQCVQERCIDHIIKGSAPRSIEPYFGQKSLRVGESDAMSLGIIEDQFGNLVDVALVDHFALSGKERHQSPAEKGVSIATFYASQRANQYSNSISSQNLQSIRVLYRQNTDIDSLNFGLLPPERNFRQGGTDRLDTIPLIDRFGNAAPVGTYMSLHLKDSQGRHALLPFVAQGEHSSLTLYTTTMNGRYQGDITLGRRTRPISDIIVDRETIHALKNIESQLSDSSRIFTLNIGAIHTNLNHLVQDAVPINMTVTEKNGHQTKMKLWSFEGTLHASLSLAPDPFPLHVLLESDLGEIDFQIQEDEVEHLE